MTDLTLFDSLNPGPWRTFENCDFTSWVKRTREKLGVSINGAYDLI